jgi:membrane protein
MASRSGSVLFFLREVYQEFVLDKGSLFAAAISFFGLISLLPLLLLAIAAFGFIVGSQTALMKVVAVLQQYIPIGSQQLMVNLRNLSQHSKLLGGIGFVGLLWAGMQVFVILQQVMDIALAAQRSKGYVKTRGIAILMVVVAGLLLGISIVATSLLAALRHYAQFGTLIGLHTYIWGTLGTLGPLIVSILAFTSMYKFLPGRDVGTTGPLIAGVTAGLLFETAKYAFRWYVTHVADYSRIYGSLGSLAALVIWIYYVSLITVLGAEVTSVYARQKTGHPL